MPDRFIYTSCIGAFLFSESHEISEKLLFSDVIASSRKLEQSEWTDEERNLVSSAGGKILFLGFKKEKIGGVVFTSDLKKLDSASRQLRQYEGKIASAIAKIAKSKVKDSVQSDELVIQAASSMNELDKAAGMLSKRLREWYGLRNPELAASLSDNEAFVRVVLEDSGKSEMGAELAQEDVAEIKELAQEAAKLLLLRAKTEKYLEKRMKDICPNILAVSGAAIGAKLLAAAGSLKRLAMMPASTLQLLGAESAMFKFLRKKSKKMPRFGILHEHKMISEAAEREKGKAARLLADKISIAARVDYFKGKFVGDELLKEIKERTR